MNCQYSLWNAKQKLNKDGSEKEVLYFEVPCSKPGTAQQVLAQSGDTFKFRSDGRRAPVEAVLCLEHAAKLREQGCEVGPLAKGVSA